MTTEEIATMLAGLEVPTAYYQFPETQQGPPFLCYFYQSNNDMLADDVNYVRIDHLVVELYTDNKDFDLEKQLEEILTANDLVWYKSEQYLDDQQMNEVVYEMDVIITEENNG